MLAGMIKEHTTRQQLHKEMQAKRKNEAIVSVNELADSVVDHLNKRVSHSYRNQKRLDIECKKLEKNGTNLVKQTDQWIALINDFNDVLKEIGDVKSWSKAIEDDVTIITRTLQSLEK